MISTGYSGDHGGGTRPALLRLLLRGYRAWRTSRELGRLSDDLLKDIGLSRGDIPRIAERAGAQAVQARSTSMPQADRRASRSW